LGTFESLIRIVDRLRSPGGCPWDQEQTHESLKRTLLEECYEVLEAIDSGDPKRLSEEMGDILVQVAFHADMARRAGQFDIADVLRQVNEKLVRRHPHVFGDAKVKDAREVERNWDKLKEKEKSGRKSPVEGIPGATPSLAYAQLMQERVGRQGFEWEDVSGVLDKVAEEAGEVARAEGQEEKEKEIGDLLFAVVNLARWQGIHAEDALRRANLRFRTRYLKMEELASSRGQDFKSLPLEEKERLWQEAKGLVG
jgi:tetrapyrrole methylase family protein/MazG family protein